MTIALPLLSSIGTPATPEALLDYLLAHALASDYSQSTLFYGKVTSIAYIVATYGNRPVVLMDNMREALTRYLEPYFVSLDVTVQQKPIPGLPEKGNRYGLEIAITAMNDQGQRVNLAQGFSVGQGVMSRLGAQN